MSKSSFFSPLSLSVLLGVWLWLEEVGRRDSLCGSDSTDASLLASSLWEGKGVWGGGETGSCCSLSLSLPSPLYRIEEEFIHPHPSVSPLFAISTSCSCAVQQQSSYPCLNFPPFFNLAKKKEENLEGRPKNVVCSTIYTSL